WRSREPVRQATHAGPDGMRRLLRQFGEAPEETRGLYREVARQRLERRLVRADVTPLDKEHMELLQELGRVDLAWFKGLLQASRTPGALTEALIEVAWRIPLAEGPIELLAGFYKLPGLGESERRR